jgi:hypothetical protein
VQNCLELKCSYPFLRVLCLGSSVDRSIFLLQLLHVNLGPVQQEVPLNVPFLIARGSVDCMSQCWRFALAQTLPAIILYNCTFTRNWIVLQAMIATERTLLHRIRHPFLTVLLNFASLIKPESLHFSHVHSARKPRKQFLNITMHGSVSSVVVRSRPPRSHLLTQPRQSDSRTRSVRVNQAHMVHESNSFGDAQQWSGSGVRRLAKLERAVL